MKDNVIILFASLIVFLLKYVMIMFPSSDKLYSPFSFSSQKISIQAYIDYLSTALGYVVISAFVWHVKPNNVTLMVLWLSIGYVIDYLLFYNNPIKTVTIGSHDIGLSYSLFVSIALASILFIEIILK